MQEEEAQAELLLAVAMEEYLAEQEAADLLALTDLQTFSTILLEQARQPLVILQVALTAVTQTVQVVLAVQVLLLAAVVVVQVKELLGLVVLVDIAVVVAAVNG